MFSAPYYDRVQKDYSLNKLVIVTVIRHIFRHKIVILGRIKEVYKVMVNVAPVPTNEPKIIRSSDSD